MATQFSFSSEFSGIVRVKLAVLGTNLEDKITVTTDAKSGDNDLSEESKLYEKILQLASEHAGESTKDRKDIKKFITFATKDCAAINPKENKVAPRSLLRLNGNLAAQVFLVSSKLTLADLVMFATLHPLMSSYKTPVRGEICNVTRWFDHVQHQGELKEHLEELKLRTLLINRSYCPPVARPKKKAAPATKDAKQGAKKGNRRAQPKPAAPTQSLSSMLNIVVGKVVQVEKHPDADSLYVEKIDLGEESPRTIVSGLVKFISKEDFKDKYVCVLCNLKPTKLRGVLSHGMVLCGSNADHTAVELLQVPKGVPIGERLCFEEDVGEPLPLLTPKKKIFEKVAPDFKTNNDCVATYKTNQKLLSSKGPAFVSSLSQAYIK